MKGRFLTHLKSKRVITTFLLGLTVAGISYLSINLSRDIKKFSMIQNGVQTCFSRVLQTYTSKILGESSSIYLDRSFSSTTEECFGEIMSRMDELFTSKMEGLKSQLNTLSSDTHWFHDKIERSHNSLSSVNDAEIFLSNLNSRFEKLESLRDAIEVRMNQLQEAYSASISKLGLSLFLSIALFMIVMAYDLILRRSKKVMSEKLEQDALLELQSVEGVSKDKVKEIVNTALIENDLIYCSKLFHRYHGVFDRKVEMGVGDKGTVHMFTGGSSEEMEEQIEEIWTQSEKEENILLDLEMECKKEFEKKYDRSKGLKEIYIARSLSIIISRFAERLQAQGASIDFQVDETLLIYGYEEQLSQILFHSLNEVFTAIGEKENVEIRMATKKLGGLTILSIESEGTSHSEKRISGELDSIDLQICAEFIDEISGRMEFENLENKSSIKLYFQGAIEKRVVQVTKGTKKEILAQMSS